MDRDRTHTGYEPRMARPTVTETRFDRKFRNPRIINKSHQNDRNYYHTPEIENVTQKANARRRVQNRLCALCDSVAEKDPEQKAKGEEKANRNNSGLKIVTTGGKQTVSQKLIATKMPLLVRRTFAPSSKKEHDLPNR